jgi:hypothetical protein
MVLKMRRVVSGWLTGIVALRPCFIKIGKLVIKRSASASASDEEVSKSGLNLRWEIARLQ